MSPITHNHLCYFFKTIKVQIGWTQRLAKFAFFLQCILTYASKGGIQRLFGPALENSFQTSLQSPILTRRRVYFVRVVGRFECAKIWGWKLWEISGSNPEQMSDWMMIGRFLFLLILKELGIIDLSTNSKVKTTRRARRVEGFSHRNCINNIRLCQAVSALGLCIASWNMVRKKS